MKIAVVCPYDLAAFGGVQDQVLRLVRWLGESGHDAWAVAPGTGGPDGTRHVGGTIAVPANRSKAPIALSPLTARRVRAAVADADVVHVHEPLMPMVSLGAVMSAGPPVVGTFHADPSTLIRRIYRLGGPLLRRVTRRMAAVTAVSPVAAGAMAHLVEPTIVPNGLDLDDYRREQPGEAGRVLFIGRDDPRKGLDVLLQAWPYVRSEMPDARLRIVGTERPSGPSGVEFLGRVDEPSKRRELQAASVLVAPNLGGESFGIIVAEGMAAGCAVVASDLDAFRATLGGAGLLVPPGAVPELARGIVVSLRDAETAGAAAAAAAIRFGRHAVLGGYQEAYDRALSGGSDSR